MTTARGTGEKAPGQPGSDPRWTSSAKMAVGTAISPLSQVWFTVAEGILTEMYWPEVDRAATRDMQFVVTDGKMFFSEEKRDTRHALGYMASGVPGVRLTNECNQGRYRIEKEIISDPDLDVILVRTRFTSSPDDDLLLHVIVAPHLEDCGAHNNASIENFWGDKVLVAERDNHALVLASSVPFLKCSAGYLGVSDGWQDLHRHKKLEWNYARAPEGNVALTAQIDWKKCEGEFTLAIGFDATARGAVHHVRASLLDGFDAARDKFVEQWERSQENLEALKPSRGDRLDFYLTSVAVLRTHQAKKFPGGAVASLSIPWGLSNGDDDRGGYHVTWPRDLAQATGGLLAAGCHSDVKKALRFFASTQEENGSWPQNMWLRGKQFWNGRQMDECAFPILLVAEALREQAIDQSELRRLWPMLRRALCFIVEHGPVTEQDRWEEIGGYSPYTIAVQIAALLEAAHFTLEPELASLLTKTANTWNENIENWTYAVGTKLAKACGVEGYYVRIAPCNGNKAPWRGEIELKNMPEKTFIPAHSMISCDALALVRLGLRAPDDPRILNTIRVIDSLLKVETPNGPAWHRYNGDGYGEHADGTPFDGTGIGRAWPLLSGERAHYELAAGHREEALRLCAAMEAFSGEGGMMPEQVWDSADIVERNLRFGRPTGSAMPLVWTHSEYLKLLRSLRDNRVFDLPAHCAGNELA